MVIINISTVAMYHSIIHPQECTIRLANIYSVTYILIQYMLKAYKPNIVLHTNLDPCPYKVNMYTWQPIMCILRSIFKCTYNTVFYSLCRQYLPTFPLLLSILTVICTQHSTVYCTYIVICTVYCTTYSMLICSYLSTHPVSGWIKHVQ